MYLLDSNILLELLLNQDKADEVEELLRKTPKRLLHLSDFSVHSIGVRLVRENAIPLFITFATDLLISGQVPVLGLGMNEMPEVAHTAQQYRIDFDDAYQFVIASQNNLTIVSYDSHFDRAPGGRKTAAEILTLS